MYKVGSSTSVSYLGKKTYRINQMVAKRKSEPRPEPNYWKENEAQELLDQE